MQEAHPKNMQTTLQQLECSLEQTQCSSVMLRWISGAKCERSKYSTTTRFIAGPSTWKTNVMQHTEAWPVFTTTCKVQMFLNVSACRTSDVCISDEKSTKHCADSEFHASLCQMLCLDAEFQTLEVVASVRHKEEHLYERMQQSVSLPMDNHYWRKKIHNTGKPQEYMANMFHSQRWVFRDF